MYAYLHIGSGIYMRQALTVSIYNISCMPTTNVACQACAKLDLNRKLGEYVYIGRLCCSALRNFFNSKPTGWRTHLCLAHRHGCHRSCQCEEEGGG